MNKIKNDKGEWVVAVGSPGSLMRTECEYPKLLERINILYYSRSSIGELINEIRDAGIKNKVITSNLIKLSKFYGSYIKS